MNGLIFIKVCFKLNYTEWKVRLTHGIWTDTKHFCYSWQKKHFNILLFGKFLKKFWDEQSILACNCKLTIVDNFLRHTHFFGMEFTSFKKWMKLIFECTFKLLCILHKENDDLRWQTLVITDIYSSRDIVREMRYHSSYCYIWMVFDWNVWKKFLIQISQQAWQNVEKEKVSMHEARDLWFTIR